MAISTRSPIVTIMGHVDHGKTSLLDYIRKTKVAQKEHGGITQHIGAYQVQVTDSDHKSRSITFIDTPGHAAFSQMRSRGGQAADIVILVVAATEGIKPQTQESIDHIRQAQVPFIVALTKSDLDAANPPMVKQQLAQAGVLVEGFGGDIPIVEVSSVSGQGIETLLETLLLVADLIGLEADPEARLSGLVIESQKDPRRGIIATVVVQEGSLTVKDTIYAQGATAKIKSLVDHQGKSLTRVLPGMPAQIMGWDNVPQVGSLISTDALSFSQTSKVGQSNSPKGVINCIIKADTQGSLEAISTLLPDRIAVFESGVGDVTPSDISMAKSTKSVVVAFAVDVSNQITQSAQVEKVEVKQFDIIYELFEYLDDKVKRAINPYYDSEVIGKAQVIAEFKIEKHRIAGCRVIEGEILDDIQVDLIRNDNLIGTSRISSLKQSKAPVSKVALNQEFGCTFAPYIDFKVADILIAHRPQKKSN